MCNGHAEVSPLPSPFPGTPRYRSPLTEAPDGRANPIAIANANTNANANANANSYAPKRTVKSRM